MSNRTYTCLICGKIVTVSVDEYRVIKQNPVCNDCLISKNKPSKEKTAPEKADTVADVINFVGRAAGVITKSISSVKDNNENPDNEKKNGSIENVFCPNEASTDDEKDGTSGDEAISFDSRWKKIGCLGEVYDRGGFSALSHCVGLYMHKINNEIMYIGRAVEYNNGGLRKRLSDYCRPNGSARKHPSGQKIYANRYKIQTYILVVGDDSEAAEKSKRLEELYVGKYNPPWNNKLKTDK